MSIIFRTVMIVAILAIIAFVSLTEALMPTDGGFPKQWYLHNLGEAQNGVPGAIADADIDAPEAWDISTGRQDVLIGIYDTGVETDHPDLMYGQNMADGGYDDVGHGTHVAGIIGALANNGGTVGVNWNAKMIFSAAGFDPTGWGGGWFDYAIPHLTDRGAQVINVSGGRPDNFLDIQRACTYAYNRNVLVVAATGNDGGNTPNYPAGCRGVLAVGATECNDLRPWWSSYGNHISVCAPGGSEVGSGWDSDTRNIYSTWVKAWYDAQQVRHHTNTWQFNAGTSMAAPVVTGIASLLLGYGRTLGINLANDDVKRIIELSAEDKNVAQYPGWDPYMGYGRVNAYEALKMLRYPWQFSQVGASTPNASSASSLFTLYFYGVQGLLNWPIPYYAYRYEVVKNVTLPRYYLDPCQGGGQIDVWGRGAYTNGFELTEAYGVNFGHHFCEVVPGSIHWVNSQSDRRTTCQLRTYVYQVYYGTSFKGWFPCQPSEVTFAYSTLGQPQPPRLCGAYYYYPGGTKGVGPGGSTPYIHIYWSYAWSCPTLDHYEVDYAPNYNPSNPDWKPLDYTVSKNAVGWTCYCPALTSRTGVRIRAIHDDGYVTQWSNVIVVIPPPPPPSDPIVAYTTDSLATSFPNGKKIAVDSQGKTHIVFTSNDSVYYTYSEDKDLKEWSQPLSLGEGKYPAIALDTEDKPNVCFVTGRGLNFVRIASAIPPAQNFYQASAKVLEIGSPSFVINPKTNEAYLGWTEIGTDFSVCEIAPFNVSSPPVSLAPTPIDQGSVGEIRSPSLALSPSGSLLASWSKAGKVYYNDSESGTIQLSAETANAIHPIVDAYGDRTSVVWMEETSPGSFEIMRKTRQANVWSDVENISGGFTGEAEFPTIVGTSQVLWAENFGNYAIRYSGIYDDGWLVYSGLLSNPNKANARFVSAAFRQIWPESYIVAVSVKKYALKTTTDLSAIFAVKMPVAPVAYFYVDAGKPDPSIYTVQREGYVTYGYQPEYTIDYHPTKLIYQFTNLNPNKRYRLKVVYYHEGKDKWLELLMVDHIPYEMSKIPPKTKIEVEKWLPHACYKDGQIEVSIRKMKGDYAICAVIGLYEYEKKRGREEEPAGAAMMADAVIGHQSLVFSLGQSYPNPFSKATEIRYQIADDYTPPTPSQEGIMRNADSGERSAVSLKIYNIAGQLVKTLVNEYVGAGIYTCPWDGKDESGKQVSAGVYFYRLQSGDFTATKKMIVIK